MSSQKLIQADQIDKHSVDEAFALSERTRKVITWSFPSLAIGAFGPIINFPFEGTIVDVAAYCSKTCEYDTLFDIERTSLEEYKAFLDNEETEGTRESSDNGRGMTELSTLLQVSPWKKIYSCSIDSNQNMASSVDTGNIPVDRNTMFRINFKQINDGQITSPTANNVVVQVIIELKPNY